MSCCTRCEPVVSRTYALDSDGDGYEYLVETTQRPDGAVAVTTLMYAAPGLYESFRFVG